MPEYKKSLFLKKKLEIGAICRIAPTILSPLHCRGALLWIAAATECTSSRTTCIYANRLKNA